MNPWFDVPAALRTWFAAHALVAVTIGLPLVLAPAPVLALLQWAPGDPGLARLLGACWVSLGVASWRTRGAGVEVMRALLSLKALWSALAIVGALGAIGGGAPGAAWVLLFLSLIFLGIWVHYGIVFRRLASAGPQAFAYGDESVPPEEPADEASSESR